MAAANWHAYRSFSRDRSVTQQRLNKGIVRRIASYARPYRWTLALFLVCTCVTAVITVAVPLLLKTIIDKGILAHDTTVVLEVAGLVAALAVAGALISVAHPLAVRADRRGTHLRPAHPGVRARPAAADRVLHPRPDRLAGQQAQQRRHRGAAGHHLHPGQRGVQRADPAAGAHRDAVAVLAGDRGGAGAAAPVRDPRPAGRPPPAALHQGVDAARRRDGQHHDRALQRRRRDAGEAVRQRRRTSSASSPAGRPRSGTSA